MANEVAAHAPSPPPLIFGESESSFRKLLADVTEAVHPRDVFEEFWLQDVVHLTWEVLRLRRAKNGLLNGRFQLGLAVVLDRINVVESDDLAAAWCERRPTVVEDVDEFLSDAGLTIDSAIAETLAQNLAEIERIERLIMNAEARRNATLREISRHREVLATSLRRKTAEIEDADFVESPRAV